MFILNSSVGTFHLPANITSLIPDYATITAGKSNISVRITITERNVTVNDALSPVVEFKLELMDGTAALATISEFSGEIKKTLPITAAAMPELWEVRTRATGTTAWSTGFVPAVLKNKTVEIVSNTNSEYVVVRFRNRFTDTAEDAWYYDNVAAAASKRLVNGKTDTTFVPEDEVTRAEFITMMVRALRLPEAAGGTVAYDDIDDHWAKDDIMKARSAGLITLLGTDNVLNPDQAITREEMAYVLARAANYAKLTTNATVDLEERFTDADMIGEAYASYVQTTVALKLLEGRRADRFSADSTLTRAEAATVLVRFCRALGWID